jgi:hypothetical protein
MVPRAPPVVAPPLVFRPDWKTLARLASTPSKPLDLDVCPALTSLRRFCGATDKPKPAWFWDPNQETVAVILRPKSPNQSCRFWDPNRETLHHLGFEAQPRNRPPILRSNWEKPSRWFWGTNHQTRAAGFEVKPLETVATSFEAKPVKTVLVVLRSNHSQTVDLGFEAQPRNLCSKSPRARCRPHTVPPGLSTTRPPSTRPVRPSPVLYTRSSTPATVLVAARHASPATCTPRDKQTRLCKWNKGKRKTK